MMKKFFCLVLGILVISLAVPNLGMCSSKKPIKLVFAGMMPAAALSSQCAKWWGTEVEKRTQGKVKIEYFFGGSLMGAYEQLASVKNNVIQLSGYYSAYHPDVAPIPAMAVFPLMMTGSVENSMKAADEWLKTNAGAQKEFKKNKVKYMNPLFSADAYMWSKEPIKSVSDFKGLSVRAFGPWLALFGAMGSSVVSVPVPEIYNTLERGIVKSTVLYLSNGVGLNLFEVTEYLNISNLGHAIGMPLVMNLGTWNRLPDDVKKVIEDLNRKDTIPNFVRLYKKNHSREMKLVKEKNMKLTEFSTADIEKMTKMAKEKVWYPYAKKMDQKGLKGTDVLKDLIRVIDKY